MQSIHQFWKNSTIYGIGSVLVRAISFFLLPLYTNAFTQSETGYIFLVFTFIAFAQIMYYHGMESSFLQYYKQDSLDKDSVGRTSLIMLLITSILFSGVIVQFADFVSIHLFGLQQEVWVIYCAGILFFDVLSSRIMTLLRIQEKAIIFFIISIVNVLFTLLTTYILVVYYGFGIDGILIGTLGGTIIRWILLLPSLYGILSKGTFSINIARKLLRFGLPFFPAAFFYLVLEMSDRYLLFWILGPEAVGVYSIGYKIGSLGMFIIIAFNLGWQPFYIKIGNQENAADTFGNIGTKFLLIMISFWALIVFWTHVFMRIKLGSNYIIGEAFWASEQIVSIIFSAYIFYAGYIILMPSIYLFEKQNWSPVFRGTGALLNICLNLLFIRYWGLVGAAFATLISYMAMFLFIFVKSDKWMKIPYSWNIIFRHFIITSMFIFVYSMVQKTVLFSLGFSVIYFILVVLIYGKKTILRNFKQLKSTLNDA